MNPALLSFGFSKARGSVCSARIALGFIVFAAVASQDLSAQDPLPDTYYVAPDGDDRNPGTRERPWRTPEQAGRQAGPGDTVLFEPGVYRGQLIPEKRGTADKPIVFRAAESRKARLETDPDIRNAGTRAPRLVLDGVSHIELEGFYIAYSGRDGWARINDSSYITIRDCRFEGGPGVSPETTGNPLAPDASFLVADSEQIRILDNDFARRTFGGDMLHVHGSRRLLFEGNSFSRALHTLMAIHLPSQTSDGIVIRGNVFHSGWSRNLENFGNHDVLVENNIFTNGYNGGRSASNVNAFTGSRNIIRFNRIVRNFGPSWVVLGTPDRPTDHLRFHNNVLYANHGTGFVLESHRPDVRDAVFLNSIFAANDPWANRTQLAVSGGGPESVRVINNAFDVEDGDASSIVLYGEHALSLNETRNDAAEFRGVFLGNVEGPAGLRDPEQFDFSLRETSPLRDAGAPLTKTRSAGNGTSLPVEDPFYFYDGYGIEGETGDLIAVGHPGNRAYVVAIDHDNRLLELDRALDWKEGAPVAFPWSGDGPDMGVWEHGENVRPQVRVLAGTAFPEPGEEIEFEAVVRGMEPPLTYEWRFGDDARARGQRVRHGFEPGYDYGVRVRVKDATGRSAIGTGYINAEPSRCGYALLHTTFDKEDRDWWVHWQFYRGRRGTGYANYEHLLDEETGKGSVRITPAGNGGPLPAFVYPRNWDAGKFPTVQMRYRIRPGTPVAVFVTPHPSSRHVTADWDFRQDTRRFYLAGSPAEPRGDDTLADDGKWHEITFDVGKIREKYPGVRMLHGLHIGDLEVDGGTPVGPEHGFWLDSVYIGR